MYSVHRDFGDMQRAWSNLGRLLDLPRSGQSNTVPKLNVWKRDGGLAVSSELPGVGVEDVDIRVDGDQLSLTVDVPKPERGDEATYHRGERCYGQFQRTLRLPFHADGEQTAATLKDGKLVVTVVPVPEHQPRRIAVQAS